MNRIFHNRVTWHAIAGAIITGIAALCLFWQRQGVGILLGIVAVGFTVVQVERIIHTTYTITTDGWLIISQGRFSRTRRIRIGDIWCMEQCSRLFGLMDYVLLRYGHRHYVVVMPENDRLFLQELERQQLKQVK